MHSDGVHLNDAGSYLLQENFGKYIFSTIWLANSDATLLNEHIFTREISPDLLFQNKNPHNKSVIDPTSNLILNIQTKMCQ